MIKKTEIRKKEKTIIQTLYARASVPSLSLQSTLSL